MKVCQRTVYTVHKEIYKFELNEETLGQIQDYANFAYNKRTGEEDITDITEQEVIDIIENKVDYTTDNRRVARIATAINDYFWDCDYEDEYVCVDDTAPWVDEVVIE